MDFGDTFRHTGAALAEESEIIGHELEFYFEIAIFEIDFGAGEFQTFSVSF